jgi:hypothetical protein
VILPHSLRVQVNQLVAAVSGPIPDDLTTDAAVHPFGDSASAKGVHPGPRYPEFVQDGMERILQHIAQKRRGSVAGVKNITRLSPAQVLLAVSVVLKV